MIAEPADSHDPSQRRRLRSLAFIPSMLTLANLLCGFAAIHFALRAMYDFGAGVKPEDILTLQQPFLERMLPSFLSIGAGLVIVGMVFDVFDGLVARVTHSTTNFGGQLDSLADVVSFGVAPATLLVALMTQELAHDAILPSPISEHFLGRATWVSAAIYVAFTAVRLARFNVEHAEADHDFRTFRGLPSPGAAAVMVALIILHDQVTGSMRHALVYALPAVSMVLGFLMVSRFPYRRFHRAYLLGRKPFSQFVWIVAVFAVFWSNKAPTLAVLVLWYAISGPVFHLTRRWREPSPTPAKVAAETKQVTVDRPR